MGGGGLLAHELHGLVGGGGLLARGGGLLAGAQRLVLGLGDVGAADLELGAEAGDADAQLVRVGAAGGGGLLGGLGGGGGVVEALPHPAHLGQHGGGAAVDLGDALGGFAGGALGVAGLGADLGGLGAGGGGLGARLLGAVDGVLGLGRRGRSGAAAG